MTGSVPREKAVEAVLFDLDGTLLDTLDLILTSFRIATREVLGEALPAELLLRDMGTPLVSQLRDIAPGHVEELLVAYRAHNHANHDALARIFPGTATVLDRLASLGMPMGVVTSKGAPMAHHGLERFGIRRYFGAVVTADDVAVHKPDPYPLEHAAALLGVRLAHCAYVGDSPHDITAARAGGAVAIAASWGAFPEPVLAAAGPDHTIASITELPELLGFAGGGDTAAVPERRG